MDKKSELTVPLSVLYLLILPSRYHCPRNVIRLYRILSIKILCSRPLASSARWDKRTHLPHLHVHLEDELASSEISILFLLVVRR